MNKFERIMDDWIVPGVIIAGIIWFILLVSQ